MFRLYAPVGYWKDEMAGWIKSRSWADCHKLIDEHDDELVREVLKFDKSDLLRDIACCSQAYSDSLVFLALRMIHRHPLSLQAINPQGYTPLKMAEHPQFNACQEIVNVLRLTPEYISSNSFPTLLRQHLPKQFVDDHLSSIVDASPAPGASTTLDNQHHEWFKKRDWTAPVRAMTDPDRNEDFERSFKERDEHGRLPHHWLAENAQTHTHGLPEVGVVSITLNPEALTTRDNNGETPLDIARRSGACAEIIGLLSLTPEEARSLGFMEMLRLYAPVSDSYIMTNMKMIGTLLLTLLVLWYGSRILV